MPTAALSERQQTIARWWKDNNVNQPCSEPFVLNWLGRRAVSDDWQKEANADLIYLAQFGTERSPTV